jgi:hypothetical protein
MTAQSHDFDFLIGKWRVRHRRLRARLVHSQDWQEFEGTSEARLILNRQGNVDDNIIDFPDGAYRAVTLRAFDPKTGTWAIWWLDGRNPHRLDVPMIGTFDDGVGTFYADETFNGMSIKVRFLWSHITPRSCRWEQAFSNDGGKIWETNWVMDFTRVE